MKPKSTDDGMTKFENVSFSVLVKDDKDLAALRRDYASMPAQERKKAADWEYHSHMANDIFNDSMELAGLPKGSFGQTGDEIQKWLDREREER
jgi:hypothetical protein